MVTVFLTICDRCGKREETTEYLVGSQPMSVRVSTKVDLTGWRYKWLTGELLCPDCCAGEYFKTKGK